MLTDNKARMSKAQILPYEASCLMSMTLHKYKCHKEIPCA